jgi:uncharacterized protein DUF4054
MAAAVTFDFARFTAAFPEFAALSPLQGQAFFNRACLLFANDQCNPAFPDGNMEMLLFLLTAHLAWLNAPRDASGNPAATGTPPPPIVGRINSASEGSVSVGAEWSGSGSPSEAWFLQSRYGAEWWQATAQYRTARYSARPTIVPNAIFPARGPWGT